MSGKSNLLFTFHRRFLLRSKFGRSWRASLSDLAKQRALSLHPNSISHVVAADWHSRDFAFERLITEVLGLPGREVWPEYMDVFKSGGDAAPRSGLPHDPLQEATP